MYPIDTGLVPVINTVTEFDRCIGLIGSISRWWGGGSLRSDEAVGTVSLTGDLHGVGACLCPVQT
jgi:hypothetical protein